MMKRSLLKWLIGVIAILLTVQITNRLLPDAFSLEWQTITGAVIFVPVLAAVNAILGSLLRMLSMPITCMTLGLFGFVINAVVFLIAGKLTGASMGFPGAFAGSILYTVISTPLSWTIKEKD